MSLLELFCDVDDFCQAIWKAQPKQLAIFVVLMVQAVFVSPDASTIIPTAYP
jgi:hypothetical protein